MFSNIRILNNFSVIYKINVKRTRYYSTNNKEVEDEEKIKSQQGFDIADPVEIIKWGGSLPNRSRLIRGTAAAAAIALGGNFLGLTSYLLSLDGGRIAKTFKLDVITPVNGFNRCWNTEYNFEFLYPAKWLLDQSIFRRAAEMQEQQNPLDPPPLRNNKKSKILNNKIVAYGPPGTTGEENVSMIVSPISRYGKISDLGNPEEAAQNLLENIIAPMKSGKEATLINADQRIDFSGHLYYTMEYTVRSSQWFRHNLAVYVTRSNVLFTLNVQCPESKWIEEENALRNIAQSFFIS